VKNISIDPQKLFEAGFQTVQLSNKVQLYHLETSLGKLPLARGVITQSRIGQEVVKAQEKRFDKTADELRVMIEMSKDGKMVQWMLEVDEELGLDDTFEIFDGRHLEEGLRFLELVILDQRGSGRTGAA